MKHTSHKRTLNVAILMLVALICIGCQQKCQAPAPTAFTSLSDASWRMIATTDPQISGLDRFNFRIMQFNRNFSGSVNVVQDNDQYDIPLMTFIWAPLSTNSSTLRMRYSEVTGEGEEAPAEGNVIGTYDYTYRLTNELKLTEQQRGYTYEFVPFVGAVDPLSKCTYK